MKFEEFKIRHSDIQIRLSERIRSFPWEDKKSYLSWLAQTYEYALQVPRILALTGAFFPVDKTPFALRFIQHAGEEKGHDRLLVNDAKALGTRLEDVHVLPEAEAFHKSIYYWIFRGNPLVVMGWVFQLEGSAVLNGPTVYARVEKAHGKKAASFLAVHSRDDIDHVEKAFATIQNLRSEEIDLVARGLELYARLYENILMAIAGSATKELKLAA